MTNIYIKPMLSKYRQCQECSYPFTVPMSTRTLEQKRTHLTIYCPFCQSKNIALIDKKIYNQLKKQQWTSSYGKTFKKQEMV